MCVAEFGKHPEACDTVWGYVQKMNELFNGESTLDEVQIARAFEAFGRAMTVKQVRKILTDCDVDKDKVRPLLANITLRWIVSN